MKKKINKDAQVMLVKHKDGLESLAMNLGVRQQNMRYVLKPLLTDKKEELLSLWFTNWVVHKVISKRSSDMVRKWRLISSTNLDAQQLERFHRLERTLQVREKVRQALQWASLFGTGVILLVSDSASEAPWTEMDELKRLVVLDRYAISASGLLEENVVSPYFGEPEFYVINGSQKIHRSKIILINAGEKPISHKGNGLWGISDIDPLYESLKRFDALSTNIGDLVTESKVDVFSMEGFASQVASGEGENILALMNTVQEIKSSTNCLMLDGTAKYEQKEMAFSGIKDLLVEFRNAVAGAADMPMTILFGQSAAGFATGEEDRNNYYDSINSLQEARLRPVLERLDLILGQMCFGALPENWRFEFNPLGELKSEQKASVLGQKTMALNALIEQGVIQASEAADELRKEGLISSRK